MKPKCPVTPLILLAIVVPVVFSTCGVAEPENEKGGAVGGPPDAENRFNSFLADLYLQASEQLDLTVEALTDALGVPPDLGAAAEKLGIAIEKLTEAIPLLARDEDDASGSREGERGGFDENRIGLLAEAARKLNVAAGDLMEALGNPPNLEAAAAELQIPVKELEEALPFFREKETE